METITTSEGLPVSAETAGLIKASASKNTLRAYRTSIKQIETWLNERTLTDALLAEYITELHYAGKSPATIAQVVAAVSWRAKNAGVPTVVAELTTTTMAGIRREGRGRGRGQVDGLTWEVVDLICHKSEADGTIAGLRDASLIRVMSDCLLRVSEAVAVNCDDFHNHTLLIQKSKTDQTGKGESLYIGDATLDLVRRYRERGRIDEGALFRRFYKGGRVGAERLSAVSARQIIQKRAKAVGVEGFYSGHSLRIGSAESLAQRGATLIEMQNAGRWKDPKMPAHYTQSEMAERGAVARLRYGKDK